MNPDIKFYYEKFLEFWENGEQTILENYEGKNLPFISKPELQYALNIKVDEKERLDFHFSSIGNGLIGTLFKNGKIAFVENGYALLETEVL